MGAPASGGWEPGMPLTPLPCSGQRPHRGVTWPQMSLVRRLRNLGGGESSRILFEEEGRGGRWLKVDVGTVSFRPPLRPHVWWPFAGLPAFTVSPSSSGCGFSTGYSAVAVFTACPPPLPIAAMQDVLWSSFLFLGNL